MSARTRRPSCAERLNAKANAALGEAANLEDGDDDAADALGQRVQAIAWRVAWARRQLSPCTCFDRGWHSDWDVVNDRPRVAVHLHHLPGCPADLDP